MGSCLNMPAEVTIIALQRVVQSRFNIISIILVVDRLHYCCMIRYDTTTTVPMPRYAGITPGGPALYQYYTL